MTKAIVGNNWTTPPGARSYTHRPWNSTWTCQQNQVDTADTTTIANTSPLRAANIGTDYKHPRQMVLYLQAAIPLASREATRHNETACQPTLSVRECSANNR